MKRENFRTTLLTYINRISTLFPCVECLIQNLTDRFVSNEDIIPSFQVLLPDCASIVEITKSDNLSRYFENKVSLSAVKAEY